jgi:hypothetical protein
LLAVAFQHGDEEHGEREVSGKKTRFWSTMRGRNIMRCQKDLTMGPTH